MAKKRNWGEISKQLTEKDPKDLVKILKEMYALNEQNRLFLDTRFSAPYAQIERFKDIIRRGIYPDAMKNHEVNIRSAKKAISDFKKASGDMESILDLMIYYVEQGTNFSLDYGDINLGFYASLESMFDECIKVLKKSPPEMVNKFLPRLRDIVADAAGIGWGYRMYLQDVMETAFPE